MRMSITALAVLIVSLIVCIINGSNIGIAAAMNNNNNNNGVGASSSSLLDTLSSFAIVRPAAIASITTLSANNGGNSNSNTDVLHYSITTSERHYQLELKRANDLFHPNYQEIIMGANGEIKERRQGAQVDTSCYYRGRVIGHADSTVTISTCTSSNDASAVPLSSSPSSTPGMTRVSTSGAAFAAQFSKFRTEAMTESPAAPSAATLSLTGVIVVAGESPLFIEPADDHAHRLQSCRNFNCHMSCFTLTYLCSIM
jgi:hypothetical protein